MNKRMLSSIRAVSLFLLCITGLIYATSALGNTCQIITMAQTSSYGKTGVNIIPEKITVPVGTCTVWVNFIPDQAVTVSFREHAQECKKAAGVSTGFFLDMKGGVPAACYMTEPLPLGKTSSITWSEPGVFKYTIEVAAPSSDLSKVTQLAQGVIEVK
jgi:hypothetical protein